MTGPADRKHLLRRIARYLARHGSPRAELFMILAITGGAGFGCSFLLLRAGLEAMWLRYPAAAALAYLLFLWMIHRWVAARLRDPGLATELGSRTLEAESQPAARGGSEEKSRWRVSDLIDTFPVIDDTAALLLLAAVTMILVVVVGAIVFAPIFFAEILLDGILIAGLYHRFTRDAEALTVWDSLRATLTPAAIVVVCLGLIGFLVQMIEPSAKSIGDIFRTS